MEKRIDEKEATDAIRSIIDSRIELTTHREIAAWTITAFYLTLLIAVYKYLNEIHLNWFIVLVAIFSIAVFCFSVFVFVHSQYGAHVHSRTEYLVCMKKLFQIISKEIELDEVEWEVKPDRSFYPKFIRKEIKELTSEVHKFSKIWPLVIFKWFCLKIKANYLAWRNEKKKRDKLEKKIKLLSHKLDEYMKLQLIESSLYVMILLPTILVCAVTIVHYFTCLL